jgi:hypothetical protein
MRYCWLFQVPRLFIQFVIETLDSSVCYFVHSWSQWVEDDDGDYDHCCVRCGEKWGFRGYSC